ncbi:hypothetical protein, partial [Streptomyces sp. Agncl-13]|uniref:hypothetical protein n=1 Tax=Streptomyces sp. Agncl-13 TaxID=3400628 RepID=UPI003A8677B7
SHDPAPDVADDPRAQAAVPAITAAENAIQRATAGLATARPALARAEHIVDVGPARISQEEENLEAAEEEAEEDAKAVVVAAGKLQGAQRNESIAGKEVGPPRSPGLRVLHRRVPRGQGALGATRRRL